MLSQLGWGHFWRASGSSIEERLFRLVSGVGRTLKPRLSLPYGATLALETLEGSALWLESLVKVKEVKSLAWNSWQSQLIGVHGEDGKWVKWDPTRTFWRYRIWLGDQGRLPRVQCQGLGDVGWMEVPSMDQSGQGCHELGLWPVLAPHVVFQDIFA